MARFLYRRHFASGEFSGKWFFLALCWFAGLFTGALCCLSAGESFLPLMYSAVQRRVSFVSLLATLILPFLFSVFAVYIQTPVILFGISFLKAFSFAFIFTGLHLAFPDSFWLVRWLLMFSESLVIPVLFWFWLHFLSDKRRGLFFPTAICAAAIVLITAVDQVYISAFLAELMRL